MSLYANTCTSLWAFACLFAWLFIFLCANVCMCVSVSELSCLIPAIKWTVHAVHEVNPCLNCLTQREQTQRPQGNTPPPHTVKFSPCCPFMVTLDLFCRMLLIITVQTHLKHHQNERLRGNTCFYELLALGLSVFMHPHPSTSRGPHATYKSKKPHRL